MWCFSRVGGQVKQEVTPSGQVQSTVAIGIRFVVSLLSCAAMQELPNKSPNFISQNSLNAAKKSSTNFYGRCGSSDKNCTARHTH